MAAPTPEPRINRVKRKPAPSVHWSEKYPPPDPNDPFAPLWVLRNRSSTMLASQEDIGSPKSFTIYPELSPTNDSIMPLRPPPRRPLKDIHYRRRSQSFAYLPPLPSPPDSPPSLVRDTSTDSSTDEESPNHKLARFLIPRKDSLNSLVSRHAKRGRKPSVSSISSPSLLPVDSPLPAKLQFQDHILNSPLPMKTFDLKPAPELDPAFLSEPEFKPKSAPATLRKRSSSLKQKRTTPSSSTQSHSSSSFVNISSPPSSYSHRSLRHPPSVLSLPFFKHHHRGHTSSSTNDPIEPEWQLPTELQLARASTLPVIASSGIRVPFGSLFANQRTIIIFIRHFWCPSCQEYMISLQSLADPSRLLIKHTLQPIDLVIVSNGSHAMINKYKQMLGLQFDLYTDPEQAVYHALGMGTVSVECKKKEDHPTTKKKTLSGLAMVVLRALKVGMPVWERGGDVHQLGGEFVLGPGLRCVYAHRMQSPKGHAQIMDVLDAASRSYPPSSNPDSTLSRKPSSRINRVPVDRRHSQAIASLPAGAAPPAPVTLVRSNSSPWTEICSLPTEELVRKRQSICGALTIDEQQSWVAHRVAIENHRASVRKSLSVAVSVSVQQKVTEAGTGVGGEENVSSGSDLVVLFEESKRSSVHPYAAAAN